MTKSCPMKINAIVKGERSVHMTYTRPDVTFTVNRGQEFRLEEIVRKGGHIDLQLVPILKIKV